MQEVVARLREAAEEMKGLHTVEEVRRWWRKYYLTLGHKRLGRLLLGQPVERLLERLQERGEE